MTTAHILGALLVGSVALACLLTAGLARAAGRPAPTPGPLLDDVWDYCTCDAAFDDYFAGHELPINTDGAAAEAVLAEAARIVEEASRG